MDELQLRKLEAYGFKSFADKLDIDFDKGITAIVGPNGSGKSNITDAIRWVLGEQNVRNLRGNKTEDIIFSGSATRRALGIAEVSLTFDNSDGSLPIEFKEVVITRRLFRSGESEFYINKARCRLKDIYDLFADTGLGRDAISVISQNKIDQVLNSRPEERRVLFEETAGITKYRNRKRESLKKLEDTEQNILRVNDILTEIENQLGPLAESAEKTRKYNELHESYSQCKLTLLVNRYEEQKKNLEEVAKQKEEIGQANNDSEIQINLLEVEKERLNNELLEVEKSLQLLNDKNNELNGKIEKNNNDITIYHERLRQSDENKQRLSLLKEEQQNNKASAEIKLKTITDELLHIEDKNKKIEIVIDELVAKEQSILQKIRDTEHKIAELKQKSFEQAQELLQKKNDVTLYTRDLADVNQQTSQMESEKQELIASQAKEQAALIALRQEIEKLQAKCDKVRVEKNEYAKQMQQKNMDKHTSTNEMQKNLQELNTAKTRLRFLQGMQEEYEGFGRGAKRVLKNNFAWNKGVCGAVAEVIKIDSKYLTAIEIALGGSLQNIITENDTVAKEAIEFLKREKLGRVTFLPLNTIVDTAKKFQDASILKIPGVLGYANELVECDNKYRKIVNFLLAKTIVANTIDTALEVARLHNFKVKIVTLDGEMLNPGGSMTGGSNARREVSFLNRAGEIEELAKKVRLGETVCNELTKKNHELDNNISLLNEQIKQKNEEEQSLEIIYAQKRVYVEKAESEYQHGAAKIQSLEDKLLTCQTKNEQIKTLLTSLEQEIALLESADHKKKYDDKDILETLQRLNNEKENNNKELVDYKIKKTVIEQEQIRAKENAGNLQQLITKANADLVTIEQDSQKLLADVATIKNSLDFSINENEKLKELRSIGLKDHDNFHQVKLEKLVKIQEQEQNLKNLRKKFNDLQNKIHQVEILYTKYQFELNTCVDVLKNEYKVSVDEALNLRIQENSAIINIKINSLEREMNALGAINPNAIAEYDTLSQRYGFIKKQADDLVVAKDYLMGIIKDIDTTMSKQFTAAFEEISKYFSEIFERLFGGGQAKLELTDGNNILESGIEISVQPPNKKLQSLAVLSGGERALTVIALLFSFLRFRPAPFSVVDEIDAPLDEANVDRFGLFLKEYAENTQFIVVTHRKGTMQVADVMHGVTVEDSGVSKIISVKLEEQLN